jgi:hypothetical protein
MAFLPPASRQRLLRHEPASGELYHILGLEPASPAQLLAQHLLPRLEELEATAAVRLMAFVSDNWGRMKVGREICLHWPLLQLTPSSDCVRA